MSAKRTVEESGRFEGVWRIKYQGSEGKDIWHGQSFKGIIKFPEYGNIRTEIDFIKTWQSFLEMDELISD